MNAKRIAAAIALVCILCISGAAQAAKSPADVPLISIENGYSFGYGVNTSNFGSSLDFTIGIGITDKLQFSFTTLAGDTTTSFPAFRLFSLAYTIAPKIGVATIIGRNTTAGTDVVGLGIFSNLLQRDIGDVSTALKLKLNYVTPTSDFSIGFVQATISASIGI